MSNTPEMIQLYPPHDAWMPCGEKIETQWGIITYLEWLQREKQRIESHNGRIAIIETSSGRCALFVNKMSSASDPIP